MANMEPAWNTNTEDYGSMLSLDFTNFLDVNPGQETVGLQEFTTFDSLSNFDFGLQNDVQKRVLDPAFDSGYQSSPANSQSNEKLFTTVPYADASNPTMDPQLVMPLPTGFPLDDMLQHSRSANSAHLPAIGEQALEKPYSTGATSHSIASRQISDNRGSTVNSELNNDVPKPRKTRKRKVVSKEEQENKKKAFLARNREAARKCRVKKKDAHEELQETCRTVARNNAQFKADIEELRAMKEALLAELSQFRQIPGMIDEIKAIQKGNSSRPPMFEFIDNVRIVPAMTSASGFMSQPMSRHHSHASNSAEQTVNTSGGYMMSRQTSNVSNFGQQPTYMSPAAFDTQPMSRSNSNASNFGQQPTHVSPAPFNTQQMSRSHSNGSNYSQQQFPFPRMALGQTPPHRFPRRLSKGVIIEDVTGFYPPQHSVLMSREPSRDSSHVVLHSSEQGRQHIPPISTQNPSGSQGLRNSPSSMARSCSQSSGRDSGIGNISPTTPKNHDTSLPDEGISVPITTVVPNRMVDPVLRNGDVNLFGGLRSNFHQMLDPGEFLRGMSMSDGPVMR